MIDPRAENCRAYSQDASGLITGVELGITPIANAKYEVYSVRLIDEAMAAGNTIATCSVVDTKGISTGEQVRLTWPGKNVPFQDSGIAGNGQNVHVISNRFSPLALGPLALHVGEFNQPISDIVYGLGLPFGHHVSFVVIFIERGAVVIDPTDPAITVRLTAIEAELIKQAKAEIIDDAVDIKQTADIATLSTKSLSTAQQIASLLAANKVRADAIAALGLRMTAVEKRVTALESGQGGGTAGFPRHRMGVHWIPGQVRQSDIDYMNALRPPVIKVISLDLVRYRTAKAVLDISTYSFLMPRDHALSEQKDDMKRDPAGTGKRHALEWRKKFDVGGVLHDLDPTNWKLCGINEPSVSNQAEEDILYAYTLALMTDLAIYGFATSCFNVSSGWFRNRDTATIFNTKPVWTTFQPLEAKIISTNSVVNMHEYWRNDPDEGWYQAPNGERWGWNAFRHYACPMSVPIVIGECGLTKEIAGIPEPGKPIGWIGNVSPEVYAEQLWRYADKCHPNVIAILPFTTNSEGTDHKQDDTNLAHGKILEKVHPYSWPAVWPVQKIPPVLPPSDSDLLILPKIAGLVTGFYGSLYKNVAGVSYAHEGLDLRKLTGTPVVMPYDGIIAHVGPASEASPYGLYIRTYHKNLNVCFFFGHLSAQNVKDGDVVKQGTVIGASGNSGNSSGPHEHCEVRFMVEGKLIYEPETSAHANARGDIISYARGFKHRGRIEYR